MARREFSKKVQREAFLRAGGQCEGILPTGGRCACKLQVGRFQYDHVIADALGGHPVLSNCEVLCTACHKAKTDSDKAAIARAVRREDRHLGVTDPHRRLLRSPSFAPRIPQNRASTPLTKTLPPRRPLSRLSGDPS